jgi:hypothetical protein
MAIKTVSYADCSIFIVGMDMKCPLCGTLVLSGQRHTCSRPELPSSSSPKKQGGDITQSPDFLVFSHFRNMRDFPAAL